MESLSSLFPTLETAPEIADIKKVELYTKWRHLIPDQYQNEMCPKPKDNIINKVKKSKPKKAKDKRVEKQQRIAAAASKTAIADCPEDNIINKVKKSKSKKAKDKIVEKQQRIAAAASETAIADRGGNEE